MLGVGRVRVCRGRPDVLSCQQYTCKSTGQRGAPNETAMLPCVRVCQRRSPPCLYGWQLFRSKRPQGSKVPLSAQRPGQGPGLLKMVAFGEGAVYPLQSDAPQQNPELEPNWRGRGP